MKEATLEGSLGSHCRGGMEACSGRRLGEVAWRGTGCGREQQGAGRQAPYPALASLQLAGWPQAEL